MGAHSPGQLRSDEKASAAMGAEEKEIDIVADGNVSGGPWHVVRIPAGPDRVYVPYDSDRDEFGSEGYWSFDDAVEVATQRNREDTRQPSQPSFR